MWAGGGPADPGPTVEQASRPSLPCSMPIRQSAGGTFEYQAARRGLTNGAGLTQHIEAPIDRVAVRSIKQSFGPVYSLALRDFRTRCQTCP
jgi:hypothetical protein